MLYVIPSPWVWTCDLLPASDQWITEKEMGYHSCDFVVYVTLTSRLELDTPFAGLMNQEPMCPCWRSSLGKEFQTSSRNCRWILGPERGFHWTAIKKLELRGNQSCQQPEWAWKLATAWPTSWWQPMRRWAEDSAKACLRLLTPGSHEITNMRYFNMLSLLSLVKQQ